MAPRPRTRSVKLPANLAAEPNGATVYYRYRNPVTGQRTSLGTDGEKAIKAAIVRAVSDVDGVGSLFGHVA
jgi:hypothetical protein